MKPHTLHRLKQEFAYFRPSIPPGKAHRKLVRVMLAYLQAKDTKDKRVNREIRRGRDFGAQLDRDSRKIRKLLVRA